MPVGKFGRIEKSVSQTFLTDYSKVNITGDTMTSDLIISADGNNDRVLGCTDLIRNRRFVIPLGTNTNRLYYVFRREFVVMDTDHGFLVKTRNRSVCRFGSSYEPMEIVFYKISG